MAAGHRPGASPSAVAPCWSVVRPWGASLSDPGSGSTRVVVVVVVRRLLDFSALARGSPLATRVGVVVLLLGSHERRSRRPAADTPRRIRRTPQREEPTDREQDCVFELSSRLTEGTRLRRTSSRVRPTKQNVRTAKTPFTVVPWVRVHLHRTTLIKTKRIASLL